GEASRNVAEEAVGARQHVVLGGAGELAGPPGGLAAAGQLEGEADDARRALLGDDLEGEAAGAEVGDRAAHHRARERERAERGELALHADVEILQVLAHDDQVDALRARARPLIVGSSPAARWPRAPAARCRRGYSRRRPGRSRAGVARR